MEYDSKFRLYLQTKLSNPHYKPEIAAQTTLVNFCVTEKGLEDQLLALVVDHERPDLQVGAGLIALAVVPFMLQLAFFFVALSNSASYCVFIPCPASKLQEQKGRVACCS